MCQSLTASQSMMFTVILGLRLNTADPGAPHWGTGGSPLSVCELGPQARRPASLRQRDGSRRAPAAIAAIPSSPEFEERLARARANTLQPAIERPKRLVARRNRRVSAPWRGFR